MPDAKTMGRWRASYASDLTFSAAAAAIVQEDRPVCQESAEAIARVIDRSNDCSARAPKHDFIK
jgi:hypothetical protein